MDVENMLEDLMYCLDVLPPHYIMKILRHHHNLEVSECARNLHMSSWQYRHLESGKTKKAPPHYVVSAIANYFRISPLTLNDRFEHLAWRNQNGLKLYPTLYIGKKNERYVIQCLQHFVYKKMHKMQKTTATGNVLQDKQNEISVRMQGVSHMAHNAKETT